ncbi:MAG: lipoprotein releasing system, ATP-binding protein [Halothiobacillus sp. 14-56-357]|jgi:lipoprotein-releasing system ATP-binding protein|uniref:lipoprotein-releasing ABC transporter ATP-binding protein LolD n=1 Tax=Halothiobacillus sp. 15-55-196 TaxID=1970382 RepID=UPI000BCA0110|nr:lipoprotein-releasing ABC transporter ATP-binding protein LolD [Halothiobacillus sp. 15-55-196]OZB36466.1 MAG: lipoprotein releasing system, ATP-binding protein [Halothiobacillus sp. 15-55-196]OZB57541.1 MAG: lipoprotein releasing system, ATP-binding protein [Halothiobacillus sp. 14-56-357]OZB78531.1 MAG: lipoprotein releasing system, ATP-binding protein [Halothiobacillus sp. 13-55-115]
MNDISTTIGNPDIVLETRNLHRTYREGDLVVPVLKGIDLAVKKGEMLAIVGASGSGKSSLLQLMGGLDKPTAGEVWLAGHLLSSLGEAARGTLRNRHLGFVYQAHHLLPEFSALDNVAMPLLIRRLPRIEAHARARGMLEAVGLGARAEHRPAELSGGERQRVAIARALVTEPAVVLADEPTGNLDSHSSDSVFNAMVSLNQRFGTAIVLVTHDNQLAERMQRVLVMHDGVLNARAVG